MIKISTYVTSDIHGCYEDFIHLLEKIDFNDKDEMYILGDIFDRGKDPIKIFDYVLSHKNIHLLKGNHEDMFVKYMEDGDITWFYNGGQVTYDQLAQKGEQYLESACEYIKRLPYIKVIDKFILVHAGVTLDKNTMDMNIEDFIFYQEEDICLWDRSNVHSDKKYKDYTIICGHTVIPCITGSWDENEIIHRKGAIYIDGGKVFDKEKGRLNCIRLDDLEEFYV